MLKKFLPCGSYIGNGDEVTGEESIPASTQDLYLKWEIMRIHESVTGVGKIKDFN